LVFTTTTHVAIDYVIARKKSANIALLEGSYAAVSLSQFSGFESIAMAKATA
jgi:hypothetical protein